jgi:hypothetical protein
VTHAEQATHGRLAGLHPATNGLFRGIESSWKDLWLIPLLSIVLGTVFGLAGAVLLMLLLRRAGQGPHHRHTA